MARLKIDYGVDLGTTNSAICRMESGVPVITKSDVLKDTMPSCVSFTKRKSVKAGDAAFNDLKSDKRRASKSLSKNSSNAFIEFKRSMGTDTQYYSSNMERSYSSEELSSEVLRTLKSFVIDESITSVVITVPAKFTVNQKDATMRAAKLAGIEHCELLQEPIAAAMAYGLSSKQKDGYWMVFDFGGGTFDAALLKVEDGIMQVFDTEGDNYLGGKNLDEAIVEKLIIPYLKENFAIESILSDSDKHELLRDAMKTYAEDVKNQLSFKPQEDIISNLGDLGEDEEGEEIELDLTITQSQLFDVMRPLFQKAVDICKSLLERNNMSGSQLDKLILVGGPTHSPLIRQMIKEQVTPNIDTNIDPMTAVATGAALYASTIDNNAKIETDAGTIVFEVGYEATSVETTEWVTIKLNKSASKGTCPNQAYVELVRADKAWSSGKMEIDEIGNVLEANLIEGKTNTFAVITYDEKGTKLNCFPSEITIIQGSKVGNAILPYNIGIEIWDSLKEKSVFTAIQGLEKNKTLPAIGAKNGLKTNNQLRPGVETDILKIPVYQADFEGEGKTASLFEYVADVIVTGDEIESLLPQGSEVDITIKTDRSELMTIEIYFPLTDITITKKLDTSKKQEAVSTQYILGEIKKARYNIERLEQEGCEVSQLKEQLKQVESDYKNGSQQKQVLQHLKEILRKIEDIDENSEWDRLEKEIREDFKRLEKANTDLGNDKTTALLSQLRIQTDEVIRGKDVRVGKDVLKQINDLFFQLTFVYQLMGFIQNHHTNFGMHQWSDRNRARQLLNRGLEMINQAPSIETLHPIVIELIGLLPDVDKNGIPEGLLSK